MRCCLNAYDVEVFVLIDRFSVKFVNRPISIYSNSASNKTPQYEALAKTTEFVGFIPQSLVLKSIVLG